MSETAAATRELTDDERYELAKTDPVSGPILAALHQQDANAYHGQSGDIAGLALATAAKVEAVVRADERARLARLFTEHKDVIADFPRNQGSLVDLIVFLLGLGSTQAASDA